MSRNLNRKPDSDQTARRDDLSAHAQTGVMGDSAQTSNKSGKRSGAQKLGASRPEHGVGNQAKHVDGAHGNVEHEPSHKGNYGAPGEIPNKSDRHRKGNED
jgi:hypothetical protein